MLFGKHSFLIEFIDYFVYNYRLEETKKMSKEIMKNKLSNILNNSNNLDNPYEVAIEALKYLKDPDPFLRDDLVYSFLEKVITEGLLTDEEMKNIKNRCLTFIFDYEDENSIFNRTFSWLVLACIIYYHNQKPFLNNQELGHTLDLVIESYIIDNDVRGYIDQKGWAHGAAHGADCLKQFALSKEIKKDQLKEILSAITKKVKINFYGYIHNEDDRMAAAYVEIIKRNIFSEDEIKALIHEFYLERVFSNAYVIQKNNIRNFLRSIYFRLFQEEKYNYTIKQLLLYLQ